SNDGGFGFVRLGIWTPGQAEPIDYRDVTPWRGEPPGDMQLGASPEGFVIAWDVDEREGNVATTMAFVPNDPTTAATTLPTPWFGRAIARSSNGPWVTVAHAEGNGALHLRVARGDHVADGVLRIEGAHEVVSAVVVPDGRGGAEGLAVGIDGSRTRFSATCRLAPPSRSAVATAGSVAPEGDRFPTLLGAGGACTAAAPATFPLREPGSPEPIGWIASAATATHVVAVARAQGRPQETAAAGVRFVVVDLATEGAAARSVAWPFAVLPHAGLVTLDDAGDGALAVGWVGPRQSFDEVAPGPPAARPITRRTEAHPVYLGWITPDGSARGEPTEILPLRTSEPREIVVAAAAGHRAAVSVLDRAERARTRIAVVRERTVERVVPLGRRVDSGLGIGWSHTSVAASWAAGNATGSGYVHVLRWPQAGGSRPRWWIGGAWEGARPERIVVTADGSGTNVGWIDRAAPTDGSSAVSATDRTLAIVRVPLQDRAPSSRRPLIRGRAVSLARGPGGIAASVVADGRLRVRLVRQGTVAAGDAVAPPASDARRTTTAVTPEGVVVLGASDTGVTPLRLACTPGEPRTP
ncbi:MAG: hypothetical protein IT379_24765, partial [Deltaproteobacteria bacterium]|nr:hypothetical protein [Deltaproteobacteria bacterium]